MQALKDHRSTRLGFPDLLNYASIIEDGIMLNKDGSLTAGFFYEGKDLAVMTDNERNYVSALTNAALNGFGSEWAIHVDAIRKHSIDYPDINRSHFPDPISKLIELERIEQFKQEGSHFESIYGITLTYLPVKVTSSKIVDYIYTEEGEYTKNTSAEQALTIFKNAITEFYDRLSPILKLSRMKGIKYEDELGQEHIHDTLLQFINYTICGESYPINLPPCPMYIDTIIGGHEFWTGVTPMIGGKLISVVAIDGFPSDSYNSILGELDKIDIQYRWNTRFVFQDSVDAQKGLKQYRKKWEQKVRGFFDQVLNRQATSRSIIDKDAQSMVAETDNAIAEASSGIVTYGYYTSVIILMSEDREVLEQQTRRVKSVINNLGFHARVETLNTVDAYLGSLPSHVVQNLRRPMINTMNLAHLLPLSSVWAGAEICPCPFYPKNSPPLLHADTDGHTPFRLNLHQDDLGHTLMFGKTGAGKSTLLALMALQFRRYENATVFAFDKGCSLEPATRAVGGQHFNIAGDAANSDLFFAPLNHIDDEKEFSWAFDWVCNLIELQGVTLNPEKRTTILEALRAVQKSDSKTLTDLEISMQNTELKEALAQYTINSALGQLFDSDCDTANIGKWACFELEHLMERDERIKLPVLLYLFHVIERALKGQPCMLILDEAWLMLGHPVFKEKIREWLKVLRKANCAVVLATQSLSDATKSGILDVLSESCATKIFLPNQEANQEENIAIYKMVGCNTAEIDIISKMIPKRQYFVKGAGRRRIELSFRGVALAFCAASGKDDLKRIRELEKEHGQFWPYYWLQERGVQYEHLLPPQAA